MMKRSEPASPALNTTSPPLTAFEYASFESGVGIGAILPCLTGSEGESEPADDGGLREQAVTGHRQQHVDAEQERPADVDAHAEPGQHLRAVALAECLQVAGGGVGRRRRAGTARGERVARALELPRVAQLAGD